LIVDDEDAVGSLLSRLLSQLGHTTTVVTNGVAALEAVARARFDLVLADIKMPGMNGFELYQALYERVPELAARLIFITGDTLTAATQARLAQIGNPYLAKPFAIDRLESTVQGVLAQYRLGPAGT
jgi:two-component system NtrC family sensor kinase